MRQMEDAAMRAYQQDICRGGDLTTQALNAAVAAAEANFDDVSAASTDRSAPGPSAIPRRAIDPLLPPVDVLEDEEREKRARMKRKLNGQSTDSIENSMWVEAKSDEGYTYYWHVRTGGMFRFWIQLFENVIFLLISESIWEAPKEGYMTIEEYNRLNLVVEAKAEQQQHKESKYMRDNADELVSKYNREKLKALQSYTLPKKVEETEEERESYTVYEEPGTSAQPLGKWQTVVTRLVQQLLIPFSINKYFPILER